MLFYVCLRRGEECSPDNNTWSKVKVLVNDLEKLFLCLLGGTVGEQGNGEGVGHSDGVGYLN